jgi:glycosyltransferase involved in cell wall biosynthesis
MDTQIVKADLHVHSHFSDSPKIYLLAKGNARECYTSPEDVYQRCIARGMDLVTITDHDTIRGAMEIMHHGPHVFLSEEISARFPDNGCIVHILAFDITEAQHEEIQRLRYNIYDLVPYLRQENICHSIAHPLSSVNHRLKREHIEQCLLMFKNIELLNGPRDPYHRQALEQIVGSMTRDHLELWANKYDLEPVDWDPRRNWTGGSDDHSGIAIARSYTTYEGEVSVQALKDSIEGGRTDVGGEFMTPISAAHNIYSGTVQYFMERNQTQGDDGIYNQLFEAAATGGASLAKQGGDMQALLKTPLGRIVTALQGAMMAGEVTLPSWDRMLKEGDKEAFHVELHESAMKIMRRAFAQTSEEMLDAIGSLHLDKITELLPAILQMTLLHVPYYIGFRYFYQDRRRAEALHASLELGYEEREAPGVAIFVDTLDDVNGVSVGLRRMIRELRNKNRKVYLLGVRTQTTGASAQQIDEAFEALDVEAVVRFEPLAAFGLPGYDHLQFGVPPLLEMMRWCVENQIDLIQASTPGPTGLAGLAIAKMLGVRAVGHYHTQVPEYAERLLGDKTLSGIVGAYVGWFYGSLDRVIVPSRATMDNLLARGLRRDRIRIVPRGVDTEMFSPERRNRAVWQNYGLNGAPKMLYVGRISKEKNLDDLMACYKELRDQGVHVELGIVGDGPYREQLSEKCQDLPGITFTGYVGGTKLAELFASADVFVFPSTTDTFGNVVLEAMSSSLPVVVTDQGGPSELVVHNRTGMIVPASNHGAMAQAVRRIVEDKELRQRMSSAARDHVARMRYDVAAEALWSFYDEQIREDHVARSSLVDDGI